MLTMNHFRSRSPDKIFLTYRQTGGQTARQLDAQTDGQTDIRMRVYLCGI